MEEFKDVLKGLLETKRMSQKFLSEQLKVGKATVSEWLSGKKKPSSENLISLSIFFDVNVDYLLGLENEYGDKIRNSLK